MAQLVLAQAASDDPVTLAEAKAHLNETRSSEDELIERLITIATESLQQQHWTQFVDAVFGQSFDQFDDVLWLARNPVNLVSTVKYHDTDGTLTTLDSSLWTQESRHGRGLVRPAYNQTWPSGVRAFPDSVNVNFTAGYGAQTQVPESIKQAILLMVADLYMFRESTMPNRFVTIPRAVDMLMSGYSYKGIV